MICSSCMSSTRPASSAAVARPVRSLNSAIICNAGAAYFPGSGAIQFSGPGKSGSLVFSDAKHSVTPKQSISTSSPGPGTLNYVGAGKVGTVTFSASTPTQMTLKERLAAAGLAGLVAYGLSNTVYYTAAFLLVWFNVAKVPSGQGLAAAAQAVAKTLAIVWAGSQVTKVPRAGAALLAVPIVDTVLGFVKRKFNLPTKRDAFLKVILPGCIVFAAVLFGSITLLWM